MEYLEIFHDFEVDYLELGETVENPYMDETIIYETHRSVISNGFNEEVLIEILNEINISYPNLKVILMTYEEGM
ncbi:MAG: hypothetical protein E6248_13780 [Clostridium sp.]|nr:hypothetical protein [Clostridium sp.]